MLKLHIRYTILLLLLSVGVNAQEESESAYAVKIDSTVHNKWKPTGMRFGVDIAGPIYNLFDPEISNYEIMADIDFNKFFGVIEMGKGAFNSGGEPADYSNSGFFFRIGADVNMTPKDSKLNVLFFGLRYGTSSFKETLKGGLPSSGWGNSAIDLNQQNSTANWFEMNLGLRVRVWKSFFTGYVVRFKLLKHSDANEAEFESYFIPGYGVASNTSNWGISYYVQYRIEWKKKPIKWKEN